VKINKNWNGTREQYYAVKKVNSPNKLVLNNGLTIKLIGIKPIKDKTNQAIEFLKDKTKGQKVFIKFDNVKYDQNNFLLCYLYLKNNTFLNAHLLSSGYVDLDDSVPIKYLSKFKGIKQKVLDANQSLSCLSANRQALRS